MSFSCFLLTFLVSVNPAYGVLELLDGNFDAWMQDIDTALVMFYAPWCDVKSLSGRANDQSSDCKGFEEEFHKASQILMTKWPPVFLAKVPCRDGGKQLCERFNISKFPTVKIFKNGVEADLYDGPTVTTGIVSHMMKYAGSKDWDKHEEDWDKDEDDWDKDEEDWDKHEEDWDKDEEDWDTDEEDLVKDEEDWDLPDNLKMKTEL